MIGQLGIHSIALIAISLVLLPFYCYGFMKWYQFRSHFVIQNRYPLEMVVVIACLIITNTVVTVHRILIDIHFDFESQASVLIGGLTIGLSCFSTTMVYYRAHLIYLECVQNRLSLKDTSSFNLHSNDDTTASISKIRSICCWICSNHKAPIIPEKHWTSRALLSFIIIEGIVVFNGSIFQTKILSISLITISLIIGLIIIFRILRLKMKDKLGCMVDLYISTAIIIGMSIVSNAVKSFAEKQIIAVISLSAMCLFGVFYPILLIRKYEGSLDADKFINKEYRTRSNSVSTTHTATGIDIEHEIMKEQARKEMRKSVSASTGKLLVDFLKHKENYEFFTDYLALCFAIENMMFVKRVVILYHFIADLKVKSSENGCSSSKIEYSSSKRNDDCDSDDDKSEHHLHLKRIYKLRFEYLSDLHQELQLLLNNSVKSENPTFDEVKDCLWLLCKNLYYQFIEQSAPNQVNIAYELQKKLQYLMHDSNKDKFESFEDFQLLYHDAMAQTWRLMESCYSFNFKSYLRSQKD